MYRIPKIDIVLKASCAIVIRWFSLNEAPLGLFKFISDYLPYFEKNRYIFQYDNKKRLLDRDPNEIAKQQNIPLVMHSGHKW
jgi:hypothetical protein